MPLYLFFIQYSLQRLSKTLTILQQSISNVTVKIILAEKMGVVKSFFFFFFFFRFFISYVLIFFFFREKMHHEFIFIFYKKYILHTNFLLTESQFILAYSDKISLWWRSCLLEHILLHTGSTYIKITTICYDHDHRSSVCMFDRHDAFIE